METTGVECVALAVDEFLEALLRLTFAGVLNRIGGCATKNNFAVKISILGIHSSHNLNTNITYKVIFQK